MEIKSHVNSPSNYNFKNEQQSNIDSQRRNNYPNPFSQTIPIP